MSESYERRLRRVQSASADRIDGWHMNWMRKMEQLENTDQRKDPPGYKIGPYRRECLAWVRCPKD